MRSNISENVLNDKTGWKIELKKYDTVSPGEGRQYRRTVSWKLSIITCEQTLVDFQHIANCAHHLIYKSNVQR
jgi:hypothetical protein